jgi:eukaryotic-like serine/threonine-protein kinase
VDFRSDQFSFGSILYEMATGRRAFQKKTAIDTLSAILNDEPEPLAIAASQVPPPLRWIVERCLAKDAQGRYASTEDLSRDLSTLRDHLSESISSGALVAATGGGATRRFTLPLVSLIAAAAALIGVGLLADRWLTSRRGSPHVPTFHQLTFRRGNVHSARFAPDGRTVVYGAAWDGRPGELFTARTDSTESHPLGISRAEVLSVSSKGELAVLLKTNTMAYGGGTLARVSIGGGSPRQILEDVWDADWAPNGEDLAVVRRSPNGGVEIQYPIGTTLVAGGDIAIGAGARVSPKGDLVAYLEAEGNGNRGTITTVDRKGRRRSISEGWREAQMLWSRLGDALIVLGARSQNERAVYEVSLSGHSRVLVNLAQGLSLYDVDTNGRLLVENFSVIRSIACQPRGENRERDIGFQGSFVTDISEDGQLVLFVDSSDPGGILLRKTDGTPPVHLGHGDAQGLSADGRWVLAIVAGPPPELVLMPTGPGAAKKLPVEGVEPRGAAILPNGKGFLVFAKGKGESAVDFFLVGPDGGKPTPVRAEGNLLDQGPVVSPNGDRLAYVAKDLHIRIVPILGGSAVTIPGSPLEQQEFPLSTRLEAEDSRAASTSWRLPQARENPGRR